MVNAVCISSSCTIQLPTIAAILYLIIIDDCHLTETVVIVSVSSGFLWLNLL